MLDAFLFLWRNGIKATSLTKKTLLTITTKLKITQKNK